MLHNDNIDFFLPGISAWLIQSYTEEYKDHVSLLGIQPVPSQLHHSQIITSHMNDFFSLTAKIFFNGPSPHKK